MASIGIKEWMYIDGNNVPKGPVPVAILKRLLEKNLGVSGNTMIWKAGMEDWKKMEEVFVYLIDHS